MTAPEARVATKLAVPTLENIPYVKERSERLPPRGLAPGRFVPKAGLAEDQWMLGLLDGWSLARWENPWLANDGGSPC